MGTTSVFIEHFLKIAPVLLRSFEGLYLRIFERSRITAKSLSHIKANGHNFKGNDIYHRFHLGYLLKERSEIHILKGFKYNGSKMPVIASL